MLSGAFQVADLVVDHRSAARASDAAGDRLLVPLARFVVALLQREQVARAMKKMFGCPASLSSPSSSSSIAFVESPRPSAYARRRASTYADREERAARPGHREHALERLDPALEVAGDDRRDAEVEPRERVVGGFADRALEQRLVALVLRARRRASRRCSPCAARGSARSTRQMRSPSSTTLSWMTLR